MARNTYVKTADGWEQIASTVLSVPQGLVPIVPTSVAGTGVSFTSAGVVTFSGSTSISLNGVFTSAFRDYRIVVTGTSTGNNAAFSLRFRVGGVDASTAAYQASGSIAYASGALSTYGGSGGTSALVAYASAAGGANGRTSGSWDITNPAEAVPTQWRGMANGFDSNYFTLTQGGTHTVATAYDGFTINIGAGSATGTIQVFGYAKGGLTQPAQLQPFSMAAGSVTLSPSAASFATATITFPVGRFSVAPILTAAKANNVSNGAGFITASSNVTATGATIQSYESNGIARTLSFPVHWQAIQMTSSSSSG